MSYEQKALEFMRKNPNADETIGYDLVDSQEAVEWLRYFEARHPEKVAYFKARLKSGKHYMVPAQWPQWFDTSWTPIPTVKTSIFPREFPTEDAATRAAAVNRLLFRNKKPTEGIAG
jgi:hypothetical protein